jgi:uncharacterized membrane protein
MKKRNIIKKLFSLLRRGVNKLAYLIRERLYMIEVKILLIGFGLTALNGFYFLYLLFTDPDLYNTLNSTAIMHIMGGRAMGIFTCLSGGIPIFYTILYNIYLEVVIVLIAYGIFVLVMRNIIQPKLFKSAVRQAELTAQTQKTRIKKYGAIGLFLFVMFPFFMTGPVIGVIIGYLLNYKAIYNFLIVFGGTLTSIIIYTFTGNEIVEQIYKYINIDILKKWTGIIIGILIIVFLIYHFKSVKAFLYDDEEEEEEEEEEE